MIAPSDLALIGLKAQRLKAAPHDDVSTTEPQMTYEIEHAGDVWRIVFHGCKVGRFDSLDAALAAARRLAGECAALGATACVSVPVNAAQAKREIFPARVI